MSTAHDPYLNTAKRSLDEKKIKIRKKQIKYIEVNSKSFFSKKITLNEQTSLPESFQKLLVLSIFILLPYLFGLIVMTIIMGFDIFKEYTTYNFDLFMLAWTIGYETIASILLLLIIKSAIFYRKT